MNEARHCQKQWLNWSLLRVERDLVPSVKSCPQTWVPTEAVRCSSSTAVSPSYHPAYINKIPRSFFNISSVPQCWNFTQSLLKFHLLERKAKAEMSSTFFFFCVCVSGFSILAPKFHLALQNAKSLQSLLLANLIGNQLIWGWLDVIAVSLLC